MLPITFWGKNRAIAALGVVLLGTGIYAGLRGDGVVHPVVPLSAPGADIPASPPVVGRKERDLIDLAVSYALRHPPVLIDVAALKRRAEAGLRAGEMRPSPSSAQSSPPAGIQRLSALERSTSSPLTGMDDKDADGDIGALVNHPLQQMAALAMPSLLPPSAADGGDGGQDDGGKGYFDFPLDPLAQPSLPQSMLPAAKTGLLKRSSPLPPPRPQRLDAKERISLVSARPLERKLRLDYDLAAVRSGIAAVPAVFLDKLPKALPALQSPKERKRLFIKTLLPLVLAANEKILANRFRLQSLMNRFGSLEKMPADDRRWLLALAARYNVDTRKADVPGRLLKRVDIIPPSLAIAQAAEESGWGT